MDIITISNHYQGHWLYQGETDKGFDEAELSIDFSGLLLIQRKEGREVSRRSIVSGGHFFGNNLLFHSSGHPTLSISYADKDLIVFGEQTGTFVGKSMWAVEAKRVS